MMIEVNNLSKYFGKKHAIKDMSFNIAQGRVVGLLGENGAGKTTLMKLLTNQLKMSKGEIKIDGNVMAFNERMNLKIGCILENPSLYPYLTAQEHLTLFNLDEEPVSEDGIKEVIEAYHLQDFLNEKMKKYSLGMKQRLALALAELCGKDILILDEPFNGLDPLNVRDFRHRLFELKQRKRTIILSSHLIRELGDLVDDLIILSRGELIHSLSVEELMQGRTESLEEAVLQIIGGTV